MRKSMFLMLVLALCAADFGAFAATGRGGTGGNTSGGGAPVTARAASVRSASNTVKKASPVSNVVNPTLGVASDKNVAVERAGKKQGVVSARAGATQKVVSNGTKVAAATTNTVVPQECQDAFYGCMDSFCMIDNESGGRCQCSDRNAELKKVMEEIAALDESSYIMATEGVQRIKMGENADEIIAAAKAAGDKATGKATDTTIGTNIKASKSYSSKTYQLDLSAWNDNMFAEDDEDDIFQSVDINVDGSVVNNALAKTGNALYVDSAKMCLSSLQAKLPTQCKDYLKILQNMYAQKIRSDCTAFENKLKQDKVASSQKLRTAEEALREAALTDFENKNAFGLGECVQEYAECMKNECGSDYSQCITLSAQENMKGGAGDKSARTIKGIVDIVLSGATMNQLMYKKTICDDQVLVRCEKVRDQVWDKYIAGAATELKAAELAAEDNMRQNCIKTTAECFRNACAASWDPNTDATNYDMCLSDPMLVFDSCKIQVEACVAATGGKTNVKTEEDLAGSRLWMGVTSMLRALQVDQCTKEVKQQIENICGQNFAHCVGLNPGSIADLMPIDSLTACMKKNNNDRDQVLGYISEIAQGYTLTMNDELYAACENAAKEAMISVCGDADSCDLLEMDTIDFASLFKVKLCTGDDDNSCKDSVNEFSANDVILGKVTPHIRGRLNPGNFVYTKKDNVFDYIGTAGGDYTSRQDSKKVESIVESLNSMLERKIAIMKSNKTVKECMEGKNITGFKKAAENSKVTQRSRINNGDTDSAQDSVYTNLLDNYKDILVSKTLSLLKEQYYKAEKDLLPQIDDANVKISERLASIEGVQADKLHETNKETCDGYAEENNERDGFSKIEGTGFFRTGCVATARDSWHYFTTASYDRGTSVCTVVRTAYKCDKMIAGCCWHWDQNGTAETTPHKMPTLNKENIIKAAQEK